MDPQANLEEQLKLAKKILTDFDHGRSIEQYDAERLAELVVSLHEFLKPRSC